MKNCGFIFALFRTKLSTPLIMKRRRRPAIAAGQKGWQYRLWISFCVLSRSSGSGPSSRLILIFRATQRSFPSGFTLPGDDNFTQPALEQHPSTLRLSQTGSCAGAQLGEQIEAIARQLTDAKTRAYGVQLCS